MSAHPVDESITRPSGGIEVVHGEAADGRPALFKRVTGEPEAPGPTALRREHAILVKLAGCPVPEVLELVVDHRGCTLVLASTRERSLRRHLAERGGRLGVLEALELAMATVAALAKIHARDVTHCDIRPDNLLVADGLDRITLTGLGDALVSGEPEPSEGVATESLPYVSPEQTRRINRPVDYRSDFYGLGVTLFECLAGRLPFARTSAAEMFHCHIARRPPNLVDLAPAVPLALGNLVGRLLAKVADDRYQSHAGLAHDLHALHELARRGPVPEDFPLGARDVPRRLPLTAQLYGRDAAAAMLLAALVRVADNSLEVVVLAGASGIGKSALIEGLRRPALTRGGLFTAGKCEQLRRAPYGAPVQALRHALRSLLREPDLRLAAWKSRIHAHLGSNAAVLAEVLPELPLLLGALPAAPSLPPKESENRFRTTLGQMVAALAAPGRPLVLVLDDLQWADLPTLDLIHELTRAAAGSPVLIIGAYRDNEAPPEHPLQLLLVRLRDLPVRLTHELLAPLGEDESAALIRAAIPRSAGEIEPLARIVHAKAQGNPLFIHAFLRALVDQGLLRYDPERGGWWWQSEEIRSARLSDNMVSLIAGRLGALSERTRRTLQLAACVGDQFSAEMLATVMEGHAETIGEDLWEAVSAGLILPLTARESLELGTPYRFAHDRVQEAAHALLSPDERELAHLKIGLGLLAALTDPDHDEGIFEVVRHLDAAAARITDAGERLRIADLNLRAGRRARQATAYSAATALLRCGLALLPERAWDDAYDLCFALHLECMAAEHLDARYEDAERRGVPLVAHARTAREKAQIHLLRVGLESSRGENHRALEIGRAGLALLGVELPTRGNQLVVAGRLAVLQVRLLGRSADDLAGLPAMHDPDRRLALDLLMAVAPAAYMCDTNLLAWVGLRMVSESLSHGLSGPSAYAFTIMGILMAGALGRYAYAQVFADAAESIHRRFPDPFLTARLDFAIASYMRCWVRPFSEICGALERCHALGVHNGDLLYASFCTGNLISDLFADSSELERVGRYAASVAEFVGRVQGVDGECLIAGMVQLVHTLRGETTELGRFGSETWDVAGFEAGLSDLKTPLTRMHFAMHQAMVAVHFGRHEQAVHHIRAAIAREDVALANGVLGMYWFYQALAAGSRYPDAPRGERSGLRAIVRRALVKLARCRVGAPHNFGARHEVVRALDDMIAGHTQRALGILNGAAALAREQRAHQVEDVACELAARICRASDDPVLGRFYVEAAHRAYLRWGAKGVARWLWAQHADWLDPVPGSDGASATARLVGSELDLDAVLRASRALSGEIVLTRLLARLVDILMTSAGARRCFVILPGADGLAVHALGDVDRPEVQILAAAPLAAAPGLSAAVVHYVARTRQDVVLQDGPAGTHFDGDPGLERTLSVLCTPLLHQGELLGVVYLDNDLSRGVFTASRVEVLRQIAAHVAIAVRNANLYHELDLARQRAVSADRAKSRFLLNMSHELRTPLNAVMGFAELGEEDLAVGDLEACRDGLRKIQDAGLRLLRTLTRILELSRLESGELEVRAGSVDLRALLGELAGHVGTLALSSGNVLDITIGPGCPVIESDRSLLATLLTCLLENACRFCRNGRISLLAATDPDDPAFVRLAVEDTGIGIPREMLARVFDRFVQVDDSATRTVEGSGIGLTIAQGLAGRLGGSISVTSELGVGSRFELRVPVAAHLVNTGLTAT